MLLWANVSTAHPGVTMEQIVQAAVVSVQQPAENLPPPDATPGQKPANGTDSGKQEYVKIDPQKDAPVVKGIYSTANSAGSARFAKLVKLIDDTDLNAMVIDVKDDYGYITYNTDDPKLLKYGNTQNIIPDIDKTIKTLQDHQIYPIARIVVFKDTVLAKKRHDLSYLNPDGSLWNNGKAVNPDSFVNPYMKEVWDYNIEVAKDAAKHGFKEIQFDYVRFPEGFEKRADKLTYTRDGRKRIEVIAAFVKYAREQLNPLGVRVSVDIFGYAASVPAAEGIGQDFNAIAQYVDVICPMIYPSHYSTGWFGSKVPDAHPYTTINGAMVDTHKKLAEIGDLKPVIRPWIQDFTATWVPGHIQYGKKEIEEQIRALADNNVHEFLLWDSHNTYTEGVDYSK